MRIYEAAKQFGIDSREIMEKMKAKGVEVKTHMSKIDPGILAELEAKAKNAGVAPQAEAQKAKQEPEKKSEPEKKAEPIKIPEAVKAAPAPVLKPVQTVKKAEVQAKKETPPAPVVKEEPVEVPESATTVQTEEIKPEVVEINKGITVAEFAAKIEVKATEIIKKLFGLGVISTMNQGLGEEELQILASEYGKEIKFKEVFGDDAFETEDEETGTLKHRAPIVTIMGHVDHGKTSLLDAVRESNLIDKETGGITQRIGAYRVKTEHGEIVFIDTPGHAAFTAMRARGAKVTDIVILLVAADDGIMPQTVEAIDHAKAAGAPIIVAINKIDKEGANSDKVKQELTKYGLVPEEWGGKTQIAMISAKKRIGIKELLEKILLEAEILELKTATDTRAVGTIIESKLEKGKGPVGTVLLQKGTLKVGDAFLTNYTYGKVKALIDDHGIRHKEVKAVMPIEILGFETVPNAGDKFKVFESEKEVKNIAMRRSNDLRRMGEDKKRKKITLEDLHKKIEQGAEKKLNLILKGDSGGTNEALADALTRLSGEGGINVNIIHKDVGDINENDVLLADASDAVVIGFFVSALPAARELAAKEGVEIKIYHLIHEAVDSIKAAMEGLLEPEYEEVKIGEAEVRQVFKIESEKIVIAGSYMKSGKGYHDSVVVIHRGGREFMRSKVQSLKRFKDSVKEVKEGYECGLIIENYAEPLAGDTASFYELVQKVKKL